MTEEDILKRSKEPETAAPASAEIPTAPRDRGSAAVFPAEEPAAGEPAAAEVPAAEEPAAKPAPTHDEEEIRAFWAEYGRDLVRGSVRNIDGIGRLMIVVNGVLVGLYTLAIAFGDLRGQPLNSLQIFLYLLPVIFLLLSLLFAGGMFFLERIPMGLRTSRAARNLYIESVKNKMVFLRTSMLLLALAVVAVIGALWVYLSGA